MNRLEGKRVFSINMLMVRWNKLRDEVIFLLDKYKIPGHVINYLSTNAQEVQMMIDKAWFMEKDINNLEKKLNLPHKKIKGKLVNKDKN
jgi:hypothetical protein